jgi:phosphopantothenoylcysteine decarboxylase/phosphopantothenate--cysteine ligase
VQHVVSTLDLQAAVTEAARTADAVIMAAAVADYRPESVAGEKIKKEKQGDSLQLTLVKNPDILQGLSATRPAGQIVIGFAAETEPDRAKLLDLGAAKAARKGVDYLVVNRVGWTEGFATESNEVVVLNGAGAIVSEASGSKTSVAHRILDLLS